jgi:S-DNA-T family DNA segregation ATPase FtsK/SpoIIIE
MARSTPRQRSSADDEFLPAPTVASRVAWIAAVGVWIFLVISIGSFNAADAPSHVVAVHNSPAANLCGRAGAVIAYWSYAVIGIGVWVILVAIAAYLAIIVTGRRTGHPLIRLLGVLLVAAGVSSMHGLFAPTTGSLAGAHAGLLANLIVTELTLRFSFVGTFLFLLAGLAIGATVAADRIVLMIPNMIASIVERVRAIEVPTLSTLRPAPKSRTASKAAAKKSRAGKVDPKSPIDPDAGGIGGTESFDPDDEYEYEYEYVDVEEGEEEDPDGEYEYEYVDEDEEEEWEDEEEPDEEEDDEYEYEEDEEEDEEVPSKPARLSEDELRAKIAKLPFRMGSKTTTLARDEDIPRVDNFEGYQFPTIDLLTDPESNIGDEIEALVREQARKLEEALQIYGIDGEVAAIESGPAVTLYSVQLAPGTKVAKVQTIATDIARSLSATNIRIVPAMAGKTTVGIEVPNIKKEKVRLKELMSGGQARDMILPMFLGKDAAGEPLVADLTTMPHMLIAGTTGSGKSVCMNAIIMSWLYMKRPDELKVVLVDPKMVELSQFSDIPHLMCPVVTEMPRASSILEWAVTKMEERYELLREATVRDIVGYNGLGEDELYERFAAESELEKAKIPKQLPYLVFIIDELADLMMTNREVEHSIVRIAQKARAVGIHLILATQRPQANVVTGLIKSNMPCRISFKVASGMDSRIVLDHKGAEILLGQGDMLMLTPNSSELRRAQGTLVEDNEIRRVTKFLKNVAAPNFERALMRFRGDGTVIGEVHGIEAQERDPMFDQAVEIMLETGRGSVSLLQRRLAIGYSRSSRLIEQMYRAGILGDHKGSVAREVLISVDDWHRMQELEANAEEGTIIYTDSQDDEAVGNIEILTDDDLTSARR